MHGTILVVPFSTCEEWTVTVVSKHPYTQLVFLAPFQPSLTSWYSTAIPLVLLVIGILMAVDRGQASLPFC